MEYQEIVEKITRLKGFQPTQKEIAKILGLTPATLRSRKSRNKKYSLEEIKTLSKAYNIRLLSGYENNYIPDSDKSQAKILINFIKETLKELEELVE